MKGHKNRDRVLPVETTGEEQGPHHQDLAMLFSGAQGFWWMRGVTKEFQTRKHGKIHILLSSLGVLCGNWTGMGRPVQSKQVAAIAGVEVRGKKSLN